MGSMNRLEDIHWVELYAPLGAEVIAEIVGCSGKAAKEAIHNAVMTSRGKTESDLMVIRDFFPYWTGKLVGRAITRHWRVVYKWAKELELQKVYTKRTKGFWEAWRGYVQEHLEELMPIAPYIVVRPREEKLGCETCDHKGCDSCEVLPCEDLTLWDLGKEVG